MPYYTLPVQYSVPPSSTLPCPYTTMLRRNSTPHYHAVPTLDDTQPNLTIRNFAITIHYKTLRNNAPPSRNIAVRHDTARCHAFTPRNSVQHYLAVAILRSSLPLPYFTVPDPALPLHHTTLQDDTTPLHKENVAVLMHRYMSWRYIQLTVGMTEVSIIIYLIVLKRTLR